MAKKDLVAPECTVILGNLCSMYPILTDFTPKVGKLTSDIMLHGIPIEVVREYMLVALDNIEHLLTLKQQDDK